MHIRTTEINIFTNDHLENGADQDLTILLCDVWHMRKKHIQHNIPNSYNNTYFEDYEFEKKQQKRQLSLRC